MKHAVILAHPRHGSFCHSVATACVDALQGLGQSADLRDLYAMNFDPRLQAQEIASDAGHTPGADVVAERKRLSEADSFIFVYPFWFNAPPAILKGYVDRVFSLKFGYAPGFGGTEPLLGGRTLLSFSSSGAPDHWVNSTGALQSLMAVFDSHLAGVTGLRVIDHQHFGGIVSNMQPEAVDDRLDQVRARLVSAFPRGR